MIKCEYIWVDGYKPTANLRSKTRMITASDLVKYKKEGFPIWGADGSSTEQADPNFSDIVLSPVMVREDPIRPNAMLVLCEVLEVKEDDKTIWFEPHASNTRSKAEKLFNASDYNKSIMLGLEQEYFLMNKHQTAPIGWMVGPGETWIPESKYQKQGEFYCGIGGGKQEGRQIAERHLNACVKADLAICGINAEVALGQWEFQIGGPEVTGLETCDHLWMARYLMHRIAEEEGAAFNIDAKPMKGDWNGSGMHTNVSFSDMREKGGGDAIIAACEKLGKDPETIQRHLDAYGDNYQERLTGKHETCRYDEFKFGVSDRTCSIRIPWNVKMENRGYLEDRRPNANADPYRILAVMLETLGK